MNCNENKLKEIAHKLALEHNPHRRRYSPKAFLSSIRTEIEELQNFIAELHENKSTYIHPAEEWLLDHSEFLASVILEIREEVPLTSMDYLVIVDNERNTRLRISSVCETYLMTTDGFLDEELFSSFLSFYQEVSVLTISEAWSLKLFLKVELIRRLASIIKPLQERNTISRLVDRMLSSIQIAELTPERLKTALEEHKVELPLSGAMIVHLVRHLREHAETSAHIGEWLVCKLENKPESLDSILSYEYLLQSEYQVSTGNAIGSLRNLSRWVWSEFFEQISVVEQTLQQEKAGDYQKLDAASRHQLRYQVEKLARRMQVPEYLVASEAARLADKHFDTFEQENHQPPKDIFVAYYLMEAKGLRLLHQALKLCGKTGALPEAWVKHRAASVYMQSLSIAFITASAAFSLWIGWTAAISPLGWVFVFLLLAFPASEFGITAVHWLIEYVKQPSKLLRYDFSKGIPEEASTIVVIPVIWSQIQHVQGTTERLEQHYLANRDPHLHFAILSDFKDCEAEHSNEDEAILNLAKAEIERLNRTYSRSTFHLFHRHRKWNPAEQTWMGWERKRGKLVEFVKLLKGSKNTSYTTMIGNSAVLTKIRYVITLDADTRLPLESAFRMVGAMHLPFNRPRLNDTKTRVIDGYGVLQPRIGMAYESAQKSKLTSLWAVDAGLDPYSFAISDPYQDVLGEGIFTGKGIFDIEAFDQVLGNRIAENRVLSHDLLEGSFLRAGSLTDIELIDDHPPTFLAHQKRQHRWTRGDWQLLPWLMSKTPNVDGVVVPTDLSNVARWQIIDNLRRSLLQPALMAILLLAVPLLPGSPLSWFGIVLVTMLLPLLRQLVTLNTLMNRPKNLLFTIGHVWIAFITLPFQSVMLLDAIIRTLYRLTISKRGLLEWVSQAEVEQLSAKKGSPALYGQLYGYLLIAWMAACTLLSENIAVQTLLLSSVLLWCFAPWIIRWLDQSPIRTEETFSPQETEELHKLSHDIWSFYEDYVTEQDNWLPPDNVQFQPKKGIAHRTSPTNIGMYLTCVLAARDFGFIDTYGLFERIERTVSTLERMEKWEGHIYNWYDTETLAPLLPVYVSTVDSGNFVACLMTVKEGLLEWLHSDSNPPSVRWTQSEVNVAFAEELGAVSDSDLLIQGRQLADRIQALVQATNFRPLFDLKTNLFSLGYHVNQRVRDTILYDLLASEARQASFVAIALGQVSVSHWNALGRTMTKVGNRPVLLSWTGTMFEYLMPALLMKTYRKTIWDSTYEAVVERQIEYAKQQNVPFGISESGYYMFDYQMNYQYRAFGVPGLGFKRGLEQDLVIAPYAAIMALPYARKAGLDALQLLKQFDGRGKYGYYEALDFTQKRIPAGRKNMVVRSYMAHHQGMSMLTLSNLLLPHTMQQRFHRNKEVRAAELLLQERIEQPKKWIKHPALHRSNVRTEEKSVQQADVVREFKSPHTVIPETLLLSNGRFTTMITNSGSGYASWEGIHISRWLEEPVKDSWGSYIYIRDVSSDQIWSPSYQPCKVESPEQQVLFELNKATFVRKDNELETCMEICVAPDVNAEVRRITLTNRGTQTKVVEVTTFIELALSNPIADSAHPAFSKLFIRTAYDQESGCLVAGRRKREAKDRSLWSAHTLAVEGHTSAPIEFETDRAAFIGRGYRLTEPNLIRSRLKGKTGSVADPAFVMRRRVEVKPDEQVHLYAITSVAETRDEAVDIVAKLTHVQSVDRTFRLAWNRSRIELHNLNLEPAEAHTFQRLASQVLYTPLLSDERTMNIAINSIGQPGFWSYGISGDRPIIVAQIDNQIHLPFIVKLLTGHEYLRRLGLNFDLVIVNESAEGYQQDLQDSLQRAVEHSVDRFGAGAIGIHVIKESSLNDQARVLLMAAARVVLQASGPSISGQLRLPARENGKRWPEALQKVNSDQVQAYHSYHANSLESANLLFHNEWGGFTADGKQYKLKIKDGKHLPAPWINVLANPNFGALVSELGTGYTFWRNSRECKLTPWSNDTVLDPPTEIGFIRDEHTGACWTMTPAGGNHASPYLITHARGYSIFEHEREGIGHKMTIFVPKEDPIKIMRLQIKNTSSEQRSLSVTYYAEWVIGVQRQTNAPFIVSEWDESASILTAQNRYQESFRDATAFLGIFTKNTDHSNGLSWTTDQLEFVGRNGSLEQPAALNRERLSCQTEVSHASCGAIQCKLTLEPGEETEVLILLGCESSKSKAASLAQQFSSASYCDTVWDETMAFWENTLEQIVVDTPSAETNILLNGWLLYQSLACRIWARTAFYQAGGAIGFRDQLQDSLALLHTMPELSRKQLLIHAAHQYEEGDVQHWWHNETERGIRTTFSDDLLWLPYCAARYIEHTDDRAVFDEQVPYITSELLKEHEHERYEATVQSDQIGTLYEHCQRAIDKVLQRIGEHGLPLMGVGDWNDGMNMVGVKGRGESVWLGWFLCEVLQRYETICGEHGDVERQTRYKNAREQITQAIHDHAWDGEWYRRAFTDAGAWLGSIHNEECRIDSIAQSWSVISGAAPEDRRVQAMRSFDRELVDRELSVIKLLTPPFDRTEPSPGYIQGYPPGIRENGAQYTHGVIWSIIAWCVLDQGDKAFELFRMLNPITHTRTAQEVRQYVGEPYAMAADIYTAEPHLGHAGWTWYTGASGWMYQSGIEWILGLRKRGSRLFLDPCMPSEWPSFKAIYRYGSTAYHLSFTRDQQDQPVSGSLKAGPDTYIDLVDDGEDHSIQILI
ncbi:GH36-type glycosyl hydrolase domain-containing protein [Paenibacillus xanthanilyticus]|uniref:GH36-type glycosyl hydrolase domain-containing protein n=1 Tax=Paenibacillus xanthanilyticus TaxID=1783531 RepID=A0ABV8JUQ4_9BACL